MNVTTADSAFEQENAEPQAAAKNNFPEDGQARPVQGPRNQNQREGKQGGHNGQPRRDKRDVHGWVVLDTPIGITPPLAVAVITRFFQATRPGNAGPLDPLASGGLPIALGEATKTV